MNKNFFLLEGLKHWKLVTNEGDHWKVEKCPKGCDDFPEDPTNDDLNTFTSCFATTYNSCSKEQIIDLKKEGAVSQIMDLLQPKITVSEWFEPFFSSCQKMGDPYILDK